MKVLWVSLVPFPPLCKEMGIEEPAHCGWLYSSAQALLSLEPSIELGVIVDSHCSGYQVFEVQGIRYYMIPSRSMAVIDKHQLNDCVKAIEDFSPDLIHIHGTEFSLAKAVCMAGKDKARIIANIQGLAGPYTRYADGGLSFREKLFNITPLDFYRGTFLLRARSVMRKRAACENAVLSRLTDVIGRTDWDQAHVKAVNPKINYHFLNETLRDSFYEEPRWSLSRCKRHTIFVSNSGQPLKGAHQVIKALPLILREFPDTIVNFCGSSVMSNDWRVMIRFQGYHLYLRRLVKKLGLQDHVRFLGTLNEHQMKQAFLDAHVYVMPSAIENSPNSLCEAQILGVPVVASYCGGTPNLLTDKETGYFYRYEEYEMLAQIIARLFRQQDLAALSDRERAEANVRHDRRVNAERLLAIYNDIVCEH